MITRLRRRPAIVAAVLCVACVVLVVAAVALQGWLRDSRPVLNAQAIAGVWRGDGGCEMTINLEGTFVASRIPTMVLGPRATAATASGSGQWKLDSAANDSTGRLTQVALRFESLDYHSVPFAINLRSGNVNGDLVLFWFVGDPDLGHRFVLEKT